MSLMDGVQVRGAPLPGVATVPREDGVLARMFRLCNVDQAPEYLPEKRSFRIHGHSTTIRLERAFWSVVEELAREEGVGVAGLITAISDHCLQANEKNMASCLRVVCLKYINIGSDPHAGQPDSPSIQRQDERRRLAMATTVLDAKGLNCPLPILRAKKAIKDLPVGDTLQVLATDPGAVKDFEAFCRATGNQLIDWKEAGGVYTFNIKRTT